MTVKLNNKQKGTNIPVIDERMICAPAREVGNACSSGRQHSIRPDIDSYVVCFTGRRGGGKTTAMTWWAVRSAALYRSKIISNYPMEFYIRRFRPDGKSYLDYYQNEPFDFEKLILNGEEYRHALIMLDEAPDIISHMASMSFKNRLIAAWVRQLRKNSTTLVMCAQSDSWIDKSMRWQIDVSVDCEDISRSLGDNSRVSRGECLKLTWYDESGQWTGTSTEQRISNMKNGSRRFNTPYVKKVHLFPRFMFGDDDCKPVFDSWNQINILDSLRRVDLKLSKITIGGGDGVRHAGFAEKWPITPSVLESALETITMILGDTDNEHKLLYRNDFYQATGLVGDRDRDNLGRLLSKFNVTNARDNGNSKRIYGFDEFNIDGFRAYVSELSLEA